MLRYTKNRDESSQVGISWATAGLMAGAGMRQCPREGEQPLRLKLKKCYADIREQLGPFGTVISGGIDFCSPLLSM